MLKPVMKTVRPAEGRRIRNPADKRGRVLPDTGAAVIWTSYWQRALDAGDIALVEDKPAPARAAPAAAPPLPPPAAEPKA